MAARKLLLLNGPNLDMLGTREPEVYGLETLATIDHAARMYAEKRGIELTCYQSNSESKLIKKIHTAQGRYDGVVYNPGAHTHYSYALRDAIGSIDVPVVEVHLSNIDAREAFRRISVIAPACVAQVKGLGANGYCRAIDVLLENEGLPRLGEGFEARFAEDEHILVAGQWSASPQPAAVETQHEEAPEETIEETVDEAPIAEPFEDEHEAPTVIEDENPGEAPAEETYSLAEEAQEEPLSSALGALLGAAATNSAIQNMGGTTEDAPDETPVEQANAEAQEESNEEPPEEAVESEPAIDEPAEVNAIAVDAANEDTTTPVDADPPLADEPSSDVAPEPSDLTAPFAAEIAQVDAGLLSYERQNVVREVCGRMGISALLVRDTSNIRWITAFDGAFDSERAHSLLVGTNRTILHTDSRYSNAMRSAASSVNSDIVIDDSHVDHMKFAKAALVPEGQETLEGRMGIEDTITYAEFVKAVDAFTTQGLAPTTDVVLGLRAVKDAAEIMRMRAAQAITDAAFRHIVSYMKPGMTEREVQLELENYMLRHGAEGLAFPSIVACGENGADPHAVPSNKRLEAGQCVVMDFGARALGYCSDMTRTVFLGAPEGEMARAWDAVRQANETAELMLRPGVTGRSVHEAAENVLAEYGFPGKMGHGLGHGVGIDCHELPLLNSRYDSPLVEGNVVTVEPGIYLPGQFGIRLEDCGVVTATGYEVFSRLGHEPVVL